MLKVHIHVVVRNNIPVNRVPKKNPGEKKFYLVNKTIF